MIPFFFCFLEQAAKKKTPAPAKAEPAKAVEKKNEPAPEVDAAPDVPAAKPGKKLPKHLALLQKQQEELRKQQEEAARLDSEEKARLEEEERRLEEEKKRKEEERARKKQKEKERIEQLKKEGKYLTKAQKEEKARNEKKLQQMLAAGIQVGGPKDGGDAPKKPVYDNKKKGKGKRADKVRFWKLSFVYCLF